MPTSPPVPADPSFAISNPMKSSRFHWRVKSPGSAQQAPPSPPALDISRPQSVSMAMRKDWRAKFQAEGIAIRSRDEVMNPKASAPPPMSVVGASRLD